MSERERFEEGMPGLLKAMRWAYDNFYIKGYSNSDEREGYISALEDDLPVLFGQVDDLVALVARLARSLRKATPADALADGAMDYLRRKGLNPSPLRTVPEPGQAASGSSQGARSDAQNGGEQGATPPAPAALKCGHHKSLMLLSADTGQPLYCELCDAISGRRDAELMEAELRAKLAALAASPQPAVPTVKRDYCPEKLKPGGCQLHNLHCGYPACNAAPAAEGGAS